MKPRLLMVVNQLESFFNHRLPQARGAQAAGFEVHVAMRDADEARARDVDGLTFHYLPLDRSFASPIAELRALRHLHKIARNVKPNIIHAYTLKPVLYAGLVTRQTSTPLAVSVTGVGSFFLGSGAKEHLIQNALIPALRFALAGKRPRIAIVQNPDDGALVTGQLNVPTNAVRLIKGSGVDLTQFTPTPPPKTPPVRVVLAARMLADKGVREFAQAARILKARDIKAELVLAGGLDPANRSAISSEEIDEWSREGLVNWLGHVDDMRALNASTHIACLPSYREGLPKSLLEAAACALPIVTTDEPGCRDAIKNGTTGTLVPARNATALADALGALILDEDLRRQYGNAGRAFVEAGLSVEAVVAATIEVYRHLAVT